MSSLPEEVLGSRFRYAVHRCLAANYHRTRSDNSLYMAFFASTFLHCQHKLLFFWNMLQRCKRKHIDLISFGQLLHIEKIKYIAKC